MKKEENLMKLTTDIPAEANASEDISHLRNYYDNSAGDNSLAEALNALNSLDALLKALEMTVEDLVEMCGEDSEEEDTDPK